MWFIREKPTKGKYIYITYSWRTRSRKKFNGTGKVKSYDYVVGREYLLDPKSVLNFRVWLFKEEIDIEDFCRAYCKTYRLKYLEGYGLTIDIATKRDKKNKIQQISLVLSKKPDVTFDLRKKVFKTIIKETNEQLKMILEQNDVIFNKVADMAGYQALFDMATKDIERCQDFAKQLKKRLKRTTAPRIVEAISILLDHLKKSEDTLNELIDEYAQNKQAINKYLLENYKLLEQSDIDTQLYRVLDLKLYRDMFPHISFNSNIPSFDKYIAEIDELIDLDSRIDDAS